MSAPSASTMQQASSSTTPQPHGSGKEPASKRTVLSSRFAQQFPRLYAARSIIIAISLLSIIIVAISFFLPQTSKDPLAPDNPRHNGTRALAMLLKDEGIEVTTSPSFHDTLTAVSVDPSDTTIAIVNSGALSVDALQQLTYSGADITLIGSRNVDLSAFQSTLAGTVASSHTAVLQAQCSDPDAEAAATITSGDDAVIITDVAGAVGCFPLDTPDDDTYAEDTTYAYATLPLPTGSTLRIISNPAILTNKHLADHGNAALGVRALGHHHTVVWFDPSRASSSDLWDNPTVPPWLYPLLFQLIAVAFTVALVKGRRFGRLVTEDVPVVVESSETTLGRGHLYQASHSTDRAATALRAGTATRLAQRLGVPRGADPAVLIEALARRTNLPDSYLHDTLFGPPPTSDRALSDLAIQLDCIEREVSFS